MGLSRSSPLVKLNKLLRLKPAEHFLLAGAILCIVAARLALWLLPFRVATRLGEHRARRADGPDAVARGPERARDGAPARLSPQRVAWAVMAASVVLRGKRVCLVRAMAARWMLAALGRPSELHIGVAKASDGKFSAHAWLESDGEIVIGGDEAQNFTALPSLTPDQSQPVRVP